MNVTIQSNLAEFNATLARYYKLTNKTMAEVLDKKGRDLAIKLSQGFRAHKWNQGAGSFHAVLATMFGHARRLTRAQYRDGERLTAIGVPPVRMSFGGSFAGTVPSATATGAQMGEWRQAVAQEAIRRRAGRGVLAVSFLWSRARWSGQGVKYVENKTGTPLGSVEKSDTAIRITGFTDGLETVNERYAILSGALSAGTADMQEYIQKKMRDLWGDTFAGFRSSKAA